MMNRSQFLSNGNSNAKSRLLKAVKQGIDSLESYEIKPQGNFGSEAKVICGAVTINSNDLDLEFTVKFDDDMQPNDAEIIIYNLSKNTRNQLKKGEKISIIAGYKGDTGLVFSGYISKPKSKTENADVVTTIKCIDDVADHNITEITFAAGTKASAILKKLLEKTGTPIAVFKMRRDWTYADEEKVDGDLMENIKKYSDVCGVSTYIKNGQIYSRYITEGDNTHFELSADTGLIGSPEEFEEEKSLVMQEADEEKGTSKVDYSETIKGYECEMTLQHRMSAGAIVNLKSLEANGTYRVCSGEHRFNNNESITKIKMY